MKPAILLLVVGSVMGMGQTVAKEPVRIEHMTAAESAKRETLQDAVAAAQQALKDYERTIAQAHGAKTLEVDPFGGHGGFVTSGQCWDNFEFNGKYVVITQYCVPSL